MSASYPPVRTDPQTDANLRVAIMSVGNILHVGGMPDSVVDHLLDRARGALSPAQRFDPLSVYSTQVLGLVTRYVKETYGIDKPANIHGPAVGPGADVAAGDAGSFFDARGLTRLDRLGAGSTGAYFGSGYSSLNTRWDPSSGVMGLTAANFGSTEFSRAGLDLTTTRYLYGQGFTTSQILHAGQDAQALGLNPRDPQTARDFAVLDRFDPAGRVERNAAYARYGKWLEEQKAEIARLQAAVDNATDDAARQAAIRARDAFLKRGQDQTGVTAAGQRIQDSPGAPGSQPGDKDDAIRGHQRIIQQIQQKQLGRVRELGADAARANDDATLAARFQSAASVKAASDVAANALDTGAGNAADFGLDVAEATPAQPNPVQTAIAEQPAKREEPAKPVQTAAADPPPKKAELAKPVQVAVSRPPNPVA
jgi:hypothetical protein